MDHAETLSKLVLLLGVLVVVNIGIRALFDRLHAPALLGYLLLGFVLGLVGGRGGILGEEARTVLDFLAGIGVVALLFRVGLESKPAELLHQLRRASGIALSGAVASSLLAYAAARFVLQLELIPSLIIATASVATSVGVTVPVWRSAGAVDTAEGELFIDVAEIDDVLGVVLMALLFALLPTLSGRSEGAEGWVIGRTVLVFAFKLLLFGAFCVVFARYAERHVTGFFDRVTSGSSPMLGVAGIGFVVAGIAGLIGFSMAIGAFFSGLLFSRDPRAVKIDASFESLHGLFTPFFFIGIGLEIEPSSLEGTALPALVLLGAAVLGKLLGNGVPAWAAAGWGSGLLLGVSMIPRAEIFMIVAERGLSLGRSGISNQVFSAMVIVSAITCVASPLALNPLLQRRHANHREETTKT